jgi:hypothetical protein
VPFFSKTVSVGNHDLGGGAGRVGVRAEIDDGDLGQLRGGEAGGGEVLADETRP